MVTGTTGFEYIETPKSEIENHLNNISIPGFEFTWDFWKNPGITWYELYYNKNQIIQIDTKMSVKQFKNFAKFLYENNIDNNYDGDIDIEDNNNELFIAIGESKKERMEFLKKYLKLIGE